MNWHIRGVIQTSVCLAWLIAPAAFGAPGGASAARTQADAQLLDHGELLCDNCFFGASTYYYCFAADNKVLIGYQKTPVLNWEDKSKNYLTPVHSAWAAWSAPGQTVPISYDDRHIWVSRGGTQASQDFWAHLKAAAKWISRDEDKQVRLTRGARDVFANDARCREAGKSKTP
jgi:hypothetical protein